MPFGPTNDDDANARNAIRDAEENDIVYTSGVLVSKTFSFSIGLNRMEIGEVTILL